MQIYYIPVNFMQFYSLQEKGNRSYQCCYREKDCSSSHSASLVRDKS